MFWARFVFALLLSGYQITSSLPEATLDDHRASPAAETGGEPARFGKRNSVGGKYGPHFPEAALVNQDTLARAHRTGVRGKTKPNGNQYAATAEREAGRAMP